MVSFEIKVLEKALTRPQSESNLRHYSRALQLARARLCLIQASEALSKDESAAVNLIKQASAHCPDHFKWRCWRMGASLPLWAGGILTRKLVFKKIQKKWGSRKWMASEKKGEKIRPPAPS